MQLQKELGRRQLAQYKKAEEVEEQEANMFSKSVQPIGPISTLQMTTRSMARQQQMPDMQTTRFGGSSINMANLNLNQSATPSRGGSYENISLSSPRNSISLGGSFESLAGEQFPLIRRPLLQGSTSSGSSNSLFNAARRGERIRGEVNPAELTQRLGGLGALPNVNAIEEAPHIRGDQKVRYRGAVFNRLLDKVQLKRGSMPRDEFLHYANRGKMEYPNMMKTVSRAIRKQKRKLLIGGVAIAATAGILGGSIYGGLYNQPEYKNPKLEQFLPSESIKKEIVAQQIKKEIKTEQKKQEMQYDKPLGVFEKMSNGAVSGGDYGGGGGCYGSYQKAFQAAARTFRKTHRKGRRSKKTVVGKTTSRKTRRGKVTKRRRAKKHINKRLKKSKRHYRRKAF